MSFLLLIFLPFLAHGFIIQMNIRVNGSLHLSMAQSFLDIASLPSSFNEFRSMAMPQKMGMNGNAALLAVIAEQTLDSFTIQWMSIGRVAPFVFGVSFAYDKKVIRIEAMV